MHLRSILKSGRQKKTLVSGKLKRTAFEFPCSKFLNAAHIIYII